MSNRVLIDQSNNTVTTDTTSTQNNVILNSDNPDVVSVVENVSNIIAISVPGLRGPTGEQGPSGSIDPSYNTGSFSGSFTGLLIGTASWALNAITASYVPASGVVGLNLSQISTGSVTASVNIGSTMFSVISGSASSSLVLTNNGFLTNESSGAPYFRLSNNNNNVNLSPGQAAAYIEVIGKRAGTNGVLARLTTTYIGDGTTRNSRFSIGTAEGTGFGGSQFSIYKLSSGPSINQQITVIGTGVDAYSTSSVIASASYTSRANVIINGASGNNIVSFDSNGNSQALVFNNGNWGINTTVDNGFKFDISGSARVQAGLIVTGSLVAPDITGSLLGTASWAQNALTASFGGNFTASNALITNTLTAQTLVVQTITSSTDFVTGSTRFGSLLSNTHEFTGSVSITGSLTLPYLSTGSVLFAGATDNITEDNTNFFWDNTNKRLGIGTNAPAYALVVNGQGEFTSLLRTTGGIFCDNNLARFRHVTVGVNQGAGTGFIQPEDGTQSIGIRTGASFGGTTRLLVTSTGNVLINNTVDDTVNRLQVSGSSRFVGDMVITGSGNTSATNALNIRNSSGTSLLSVRNDGITTVGGQLNVSSLIYGSAGTITIEPGNSFASIRLKTFEGGSTIIANADNFQPTTINVTSLILNQFFSPTSGIATYISTRINPTINQTGGANGITRGLYVNPTLTAAADWRSIEWTNNISTAPSQSWGLYGSGSAPNYINGSVSIGTLTTGNALTVSGSSVMSGSLNVTQGITSSLFGTASWAQNALTASFVSTASLASNFFVQGGNSFGTTALLGTNDSQSLAFETSGSVRMFISSSGNVGIGTSTPTVALQVASDAIISDIRVGTGPGTGNVYIGQSVGGISTTNAQSMDDNVFIGRSAGSTFSGNSNGNVAIGVSSLRGGSNVEYNTAVGFLSLQNYTGQYTTALGYNAGGNLTSGGFNTIIGYNTGLGITTGASNTIIGAQITGLASNLANTIAISDGAGTIRIYSPSTGNVLIQNGGTFTDTGERLQVSGSTKLNGNTQVTGSLIATAKVESNEVILGSNENVDKIYIGTLSAGSYGIRGFSYSGALTIASGYLFTGGKIILYGQTATGGLANGILMNNKVGINTAPTTYALDVSGSSRFTDSMIITGSLTVTQGITGSLFGTSSWANNAVSASQATTASSADNFTVRGTLTAQTIVVQTITSSTDFVSGSTIFGNNLNNTHQFTGSVSITGSLTTIGSNLMSGSLLTTNVSTGYIIEARNNSGNSAGFSVIGNNVEVIALNAIVGFVGSRGSLDLRGYSGGSTGNTTSPAATIANAFNYNASSTNTPVLTISPSINQTGTAGYTLLDLAPTINTTGSGISYYIKSPNFNVLSTGNVQISGSVLVTGSLSVIQGITSSLFGTASWAQNAVTASYALTAQTLLGSVVSASYAATASYATNFYVSGTLNVGNTNIEFQENTNVTSGTWRVISSEPTASYRAAFFDYVMFSGSIARAGTIYSVWSASYAEYYENYTGDVGGSTAGVTLQAAISGSNIQLQATASNNAWTIRSLVRML
jgi:hypothetical protein